MKNKTVLFITHRYPKGNNTILEKDTIRALYKSGYKIVVIAPTERRNKEKTHIYNDDGIEVLYVKTGNNFNRTSKIEKIITILTRSYLIEKAIQKYLKNRKFDIIFGYTPFMANYKLFSKLKKIYASKIVLFLWDIFPQNGKDLGLIKSNIFFKFLKYREKMMYKTFDNIICNCEGQIDYILKNNYKNKKKLFLIRNSEFSLNRKPLDKDKLKLELGFNKNDIISIFGGNMGVPQELENLVYMIDELKTNKNLKFIFLGDGTEKDKLKKIKQNNEIENLKIFDSVEREKYEKMLQICDIGLISLNSKYTVPNFPAKITGYVKEGIPIFASLDECSIKYLGKFIKENKIGDVAIAGDIEGMKESFNNIVRNLSSYKKELFEEVYIKNFNANDIKEKIKKGVDE